MHRLVAFACTALFLASCAQSPPEQPLAGAPPPAVIEKMAEKPPPAMVAEKPAPMVEKRVEVPAPAPRPQVIVREKQAPPKVVVIEKPVIVEKRTTTVVVIDKRPKCEGLAEAACKARGSECGWSKGLFKKAVCGDAKRPASTAKSKTASSNCHWVKGYTRSNGTRVAGYRRCRD